MKTRQESLFDNDIASKDPTLGSAYELNDKNPIGISGMNPAVLFDVSRLEKYPR